MKIHSLSLKYKIHQNVFFQISVFFISRFTKKVKYVFIDFYIHFYYYIEIILETPIEIIYK